MWTDIGATLTFVSGWVHYSRVQLRRSRLNPTATPRSSTWTGGNQGRVSFLKELQVLCGLPKGRQAAAWHSGWTGQALLWH